METSNIIEVTHLNKQFLVDKQPMEVLHDISLQVKQGEFITIVGHSGCGKSTLLKIICGLVGYEDGQVERNGHPVTGPGPKCGMVFQDHRLLPWLKIKDNVGFGLGDLPKQEREEKVRKHLELVGLAGFENSYPSQLSGGMSQRAAIARGLANNPTILLLDEPFGALDAFTRDQMQTLLLKLWQETGKQVLLITHDIEEAVFMATELVLLSPGPGRVLERLPLNFARRFVAGEPSRSIKSDPQFIAMREYVLSRVFEQREAFS